MFNYRVLGILKRELKERIFTKSFIISTLALPAILVIIGGFQYYLMKSADSDKMSILIAVQEDYFVEGIKNEFKKNDRHKKGDLKLSFEVLGQKSFDTFFKEHQKDVLKGDINAILFVSKESLKNKVVKLYTKSSKNLSLEKQLSRVLNRFFINKYFHGSEISPADISFAKSGVIFNSFRVSKNTVKKQNGSNLMLSYIFSFLLYISLMMVGTWIMTSVLEEKSGRVCEVILSSVKAKELMAGKILGTTITGVLQMLIWLSPIFAIIIFKLPILPAGMLFQVNIFIFVYFLINFFIGLLTFVGLFAMVGSIFNDAQEAQAGVTPLMMLIMLPFFIAMFLITHPNNVLGLICSMLPFTAIMVMPARMVLNSVPWWQIALSFAVNIGVIFAIFPIAGKIYSIGILRTGKKPTLKEFIKWIRM